MIVLVKSLSRVEGFGSLMMLVLLFNLLDHSFDLHGLAVVDAQVVLVVL